MDSSTRLYTRLGEIPEDPNDPESLEDLLVCAFGAFERYYVCWKTRGGEYRQDGYDLPPALKDWLYPSDGSTRDFATLQVVFGRGEEYFASDKNGKMEYKEPEMKKPMEDEEKLDKHMMRRSRTVSFFRPVSRTSTASDISFADSTRTGRSSSISSQRATRPPSISSSRTSTDNLSGLPTQVSTQSALHSHRLSRSSLNLEWPNESGEHASRIWVEKEEEIDSTATPRMIEAPVEPPPPSWPRPLTLSSRANPRSVEVPSAPLQATATHCCACGASGSSQMAKSKYVDASVQTEAESVSSRTALRIDTTSIQTPSYPSYSAVSGELQTPTTEGYNAANPVFMGRMMDYFSKPGYQLGDSLFSGYTSYQPIVYHYQDEFGPEALR